MIYVKAVPNINVKLSDPKYIPVRAHSSDAGADLLATVRTWLPKGERTLVPTGVAVSIPVGYVGLLIPRSSLSKKEIIMSNSVGVIDSDYRGEIMAALTYIGNDSDGIMLNAGERIVQLLIMPIILPKFIEVNNLDETARGEGGFGSTGR
jgi:dUTP pyrophosphatase